jgi:hypothetical protein
MSRYFGVFSTLLLTMGILTGYAAVCYADDGYDDDGSYSSYHTPKTGCDCYCGCFYDPASTIPSKCSLNDPSKGVASACVATATQPCTPPRGASGCNCNSFVDPNGNSFCDCS